MTKGKVSLTRMVDTSGAMLLIPKKEFQDQLIARIKIGEELLARQVQTQSQLNLAQKEYEIWNDQNSILLKQSFNDPQNEYKVGYDYINVKGGFFSSNSFEEIKMYLTQDLKIKVEYLTKLVEKLPKIKYKERKVTVYKTEIKEITSNNKVFIIHGHNDEIKSDVTRILEKLGIEPITLHEKTNENLIEIIENNADAAFAIVLLSDDDLGKAQEENSLNPRAGQNVILELGYFIGKLGINRVCALHNNKIELPGDKHDLVYIPIDSSAHWQIDLAKKLKAAGYRIDINNII